MSMTTGYRYNFVNADRLQVTRIQSNQAQSSRKGGPQPNDQVYQKTGRLFKSNQYHAL